MKETKIALGIVAALFITFIAVNRVWWYNYKSDCEKLFKEEVMAANRLHIQMLNDTVARISNPTDKGFWRIRYEAPLKNCGPTCPYKYDRFNFIFETQLAPREAVDINVFDPPRGEGRFGAEADTSRIEIKWALTGDASQCHSKID